jgi:hypothetical protein
MDINKLETKDKRFETETEKFESKNLQFSTLNGDVTEGTSNLEIGKYGILESNET